jgi:hypothetical protein
MTSVRYAICELKVACGTAGIGCRIVRISTVTFVTLVYSINLFVIHLIMSSVALCV